jgi:hypothetical protein
MTTSADPSGEPESPNCASLTFLSAVFSPAELEAAVGMPPDEGWVVTTQGQEARTRSHPIR